MLCQSKNVFPYENIQNPLINESKTNNNETNELKDNYYDKINGKLLQYKKNQVPKLMTNEEILQEKARRQSLKNSFLLSQYDNLMNKNNIGYRYRNNNLPQQLSLQNYLNSQINNDVLLAQQQPQQLSPFDMPLQFLHLQNNMANYNPNPSFLFQPMKDPFFVNQRFSQIQNSAYSPIALSSQAQGPILSSPHQFSNQYSQQLQNIYMPNNNIFNNIPKVNENTNENNVINNRNENTDSVKNENLLSNSEKNSNPEIININELQQILNNNDNNNSLKVTKDEDLNSVSKDIEKEITTKINDNNKEKSNNEKEIKSFINNELIINEMDIENNNNDTESKENNNKGKEKIDKNKNKLKNKKCNKLNVENKNVNENKSQDNDNNETESKDELKNKIENENENKNENKNENENGNENGNEKNMECESESEKDTDNVNEKITFYNYISSPPLNNKKLDKEFNNESSKPVQLRSPESHSPEPKIKISRRIPIQLQSPQSQSQTPQQMKSPTFIIPSKKNNNILTSPTEESKSVLASPSTNSLNKFIKINQKLEETIKIKTDNLSSSSEDQFKNTDNENEDKMELVDKKLNSEIKSMKDKKDNQGKDNKDTKILNDHPLVYTEKQLINKEKIDDEKSNKDLKEEDEKMEMEMDIDKNNEKEKEENKEVNEEKIIEKNVPVVNETKTNDSDMIEKSETIKLSTENSVVNSNKEKQIESGKTEEKEMNIKPSNNTDFVDDDDNRDQLSNMEIETIAEGNINMKIDNKDTSKNQNEKIKNDEAAFTAKPSLKNNKGQSSNNINSFLSTSNSNKNPNNNNNNNNSNNKYPPRVNVLNPKFQRYLQQQQQQQQNSYMRFRSFDNIPMNFAPPRNQLLFQSKSYNQYLPIGSNQMIPPQNYYSLQQNNKSIPSYSLPSNIMKSMNYNSMYYPSGPIHYPYSYPLTNMQNNRFYGNMMPYNYRRFGYGNSLANPSMYYNSPHYPLSTISSPAFNSMNDSPPSTPIKIPPLSAFFKKDSPTGQLLSQTMNRPICKKRPKLKIKTTMDKASKTVWFGKRRYLKLPEFDGVIHGNFALRYLNFFLLKNKKENDIRGFEDYINLAELTIPNDINNTIDITSISENKLPDYQKIFDKYIQTTSFISLKVNFLIPKQFTENTFMNTLIFETNVFRRIKCTTTVYSFGKKILETDEICNASLKENRYILNFKLVNQFFTDFLTNFDEFKTFGEIQFAFENIAIIQQFNDITIFNEEPRKWLVIGYQFGIGDGKIDIANVKDLGFSD